MLLGVLSGAHKEPKVLLGGNQGIIYREMYSMFVSL